MRVCLSLCVCLALTPFLGAQINVPSDQPTIAAAVAAAVAGDEILVAAGTYSENVTIDRRVTITGAGNGLAGTILSGTVTIQADGLSAADPILLRDLRITGAGDGVRFSSAQSFFRAERVAFVGNASDGIDFNLGLGAPVTEVAVIDCLFEANNIGIRASSNAQVEDVTITDCDFLQNTFAGLVLSGTNNVGGSITRNWSVTGGSFVGNDTTDTTSAGGGMWLRTAGAGSEIVGFSIDGVLFQDNGSANPFNRFGVSFFARDNTTITNVSVSNCTFRETAAGGTMTVGVAVDVGPLGTLTSPVVVDGCLFRDTISAVNGFPGTFDLTNATFINVANPALPGVGNGPMDAALVDVDDDGISDIATADMGSDTVSILGNDGSGVFSAPAVTVALTAGDAPRAIVGQRRAGLDRIAVACSGSGQLRFLEGNVVVTSVALSHPAPVGLAAGDLNGDGEDDIVVGYEGDLFASPGAVEVVISGAAQTLVNGAPSTGAIKAVALADLNGDGHLDVVATQGGGFSAPGADFILTWLGDGNGGFSFGSATATGQTPSALDVLDIDGDGDRDVLVSEGDFANAAAAGIVIYLNDGTGALTGGSTLIAGLAPLGVRALDLDEDSLPGFFAAYDMVTIDASQTISIHRDFAAGSFASVETQPLFVTPTSITVGDVSGDGVDDVIITALGLDSAIVLLSPTPALNQPYGTGCAGTAGVVTLSGQGLPSFDDASYTVTIGNARPFAPALLAVSLGYQDLDLGGCSLYLQPDFTYFTLFTSLMGQAELSFAMPPADPAFVGLNVYLQGAVFDPAASGFLALSNGLRLKLGYPLLP